jgi:hypothetical protein
MEEAARAKYMADPNARRILSLTEDAELWHVVPRGKPTRFLHLEKIREEEPSESKRMRMDTAVHGIVYT